MDAGEFSLFEHALALFAEDNPSQPRVSPLSHSQEARKDLEERIAEQAEMMEFLRVSSIGDGVAAEAAMVERQSLVRAIVMIIGEHSNNAYVVGALCALAGEIQGSGGRSGLSGRGKDTIVGRGVSDTLNSLNWFHDHGDEFPAYELSCTQLGKAEAAFFAAQVCAKALQHAQEMLEAYQSSAFMIDELGGVPDKIPFESMLEVCVRTLGWQMWDPVRELGVNPFAYNTLLTRQQAVDMAKKGLIREGLAGDADISYRIIGEPVIVIREKSHYVLQAAEIQPISSQ